jgi:membrane protein implicated in regulation of membrane protease activity
LIRFFRNCYLGAPAFLVAWLAIGATAAHAYVGPTAGIGLFSAATGFLVAFFSAIGVILAWPIRALMRKVRGPKAKPEVESANA